jgi:hypothetical protein
MSMSVPHHEEESRAKPYVCANSVISVETFFNFYGGIQYSWAGLPPKTDHLRLCKTSTSTELTEQDGADGIELHVNDSLPMKLRFLHHPALSS